jgi:hypothetical protein
MTIRQFIKTYRAELDSHIRKALGKHGDLRVTFSDEDRRQWILNDEVLYRWARREGVKV